VNRHNRRHYISSLAHSLNWRHQRLCTPIQDPMAIYKYIIIIIIIIHFRLPAFYHPNVTITLERSAIITIYRLSSVCRQWRECKKVTVNSQLVTESWARAVPEERHRPSTSTKLILLADRGAGVNNLPKVVTQLLSRWELNLRPIDCKSNALPRRQYATWRECIVTKRLKLGSRGLD